MFVPVIVIGNCKTQSIKHCELYQLLRLQYMEVSEKIIGEFKLCCM